MDAGFSLRHADWSQDSSALKRVRRHVFIEEQGVPETLELDEYDALCRHVLVSDAQGQPVGTGRIKPDGHIGRMAVLAEYRGQGIGSAVLLALMGCALQDKQATVFLHAQLEAVPFYEKHGFTVNSAIFMDAGIAHRTMIRAVR